MLLIYLYHTAAEIVNASNGYGYALHVSVNEDSVTTKYTYNELVDDERYGGVYKGFPRRCCVGSEFRMTASFMNDQTMYPGSRSMMCHGGTCYRDYTVSIGQRLLVILEDID